MEIDGTGGADLTMTLEVGGECLLHWLETSRHRATDLGLDHRVKKRTTRCVADLVIQSTVVQATMAGVLLFGRVTYEMMESA
ncbi:MAG: hypothetical protein ACHQ7M_22550 [Chloroflexota bacterium]|jgi:hypothetical protein